MRLSEVDALLSEMIGHSRPTSARERYTALNHGYRRMIRAVRQLKGGYCTQVTGALVIPANTTRVPLDDKTLFPLGVRRINQIISLGPNAPKIATGSVGYGGDGYGDSGYGGGVTPNTTSTVTGRWTYCDAESPTFMEAEMASPCNGGQFYDLVFPGGVPTLALAPALATDDTPLIVTVYEPPRLTDPTQLLDPVLADCVEAILAYAMEWLTRIVNDTDTDRWGADADRLRNEVLQDLAQRVEQNSRHIESAFADLGDY